MKRPKIGDVVEIKTDKGLGYALYTHRHSAPPKLGDLIRVFAGLHSERPTPTMSVVTDDILFTTFVPLHTFVSRGLIEIVGRIDVPPELTIFPTFRSGTPDPKTKRVATWWLWDGAKEWRVGRLTPEQALFPLLGVWTYALLVHRVEEGWRAENDPVLAAELPS